jgi:hypothetical protein
LRAAAEKARGARTRVRELLAATERVLAAIEVMLAAEIPNAAALRTAADEAARTRRAADEALLGMVEAADLAQDALGARTRLVVR